MVSVITIIYSVILVYQLVNNKFVTNSSSTNFLSVNNGDLVDVSKTGFSFAFSVEGVDFDQLIDETYFKMELVMSYTEYDDNYDLSNLQQDYIGLVRCNESDGSFDNYFQDLANLEEYLCPDSTDLLRLQGLWGSSKIVQQFDFIFTY